MARLVNSERRRFCKSLATSGVVAIGAPFAISNAAEATEQEDSSLAARVSIDTLYGSITAEIFVRRAPVTSRNFLRYVDEKRYSNATFYRALRPDNGTHLPGLKLIQGGIDPSCLHPPLPAIAHEPTSFTGLSHVRGAVSMARWDPGTAASEFFIVAADAPELDAGGDYGEGFAVFGQVTDGMSVVQRIVACATGRAQTQIDYLQDAALIAPVPFRVERAL